MNISIIIPNYNGKHLLEKNIPSVLEAAEFYRKEEGGSIEIIIVDDASLDESQTFIKSQISSLWGGKEGLKISFLHNEKNMGFSSTVNKGIAVAKGDIVLLLNTDVVPQKDFLTPLIKDFADPRVFAVGCMDRSIENGAEVLRGRGVGRWERGFLIHSRGEIDKKNTLWVSAGSGAFRKSLLHKIGALDEIYNPFYWEDIDLSYRALKAGYLLVFERKSEVTHHHAAGAIQSSYAQNDITAIAYRNQFIFVWKNATGKTLFAHLEWLPYHYAKALLRGDSAWFKGFFTALVLLPKIITRRLTVRKYFVKSDQETVREFE